MPFAWTSPCGEIRPAWEGPERKPLAVLACVHGMSGSGDQFAPLAEEIPWVKTYGIELLGQGQDPDPLRRGALLDVPRQLCEIEAFLDAVRARHSGLPVFLIGESMGSLLSAAFAAHRQEHGLAGVILSVPVVALRRPVPAFATHLVRWLARVAPSLRCPPSRFVNGKSTAPPLTRDVDYQNSLSARPHHLRAYTFRFLSEIGDLIRDSHTHAARLDAPVLVLAAGQDCFVTVPQIEDWFRAIRSPDKTLKIYPEAYHLLWHDWDRPRVIEDLAAWMKSRLSSPTPSL